MYSDDLQVNNAAVGGVEYGQEFDTNEEKVISRFLFFFFCWGFCNLLFLYTPGAKNQG